MLCISACAFARSQASELVIGRNAVQSIVASTRFTDQGRWYLTMGDCYAYLENPRVTLVAGRLVMNAHLLSRVGVEVVGSCVVPGFASGVQLSGKFIGTGWRLTLQDIRVTKIEDEATRQDVEVLQSAAGTSLPPAVNVDLMHLLKPALVPGTNIKVTVAAVAPPIASRFVYHRGVRLSRDLRYTPAGIAAPDGASSTSRHQLPLGMLLHKHTRLRTSMLKTSDRKY